VQPHLMASGARGRRRLLLVCYGCCFHRSLRIEDACMARTVASSSGPAQFIDTPIDRAEWLTGWLPSMDGYGVDRRRLPQGTGEGVR
jgi:hypothetical protein